MQVVIIHPEQWNGGSDRCSVALLNHFVSQGHQVIWLTTMIDDYWKDHKFEGVEIRNLNMRLHPGDWWSQNVALGWHMMRSDLNPDVCVIDHSASCVPMIKYRFPKCKILFYCHFPQQLVTPSRFFLYRWYSKIIGTIESMMFEQVDCIMVNSHFTASHFQRVMPQISADKLKVVYPPCDVDANISSAVSISRRARPPNAKYTFMSMNRFWPEKRLEIIVIAASILKKEGHNFTVQIAGSVMPLIPESKIYYDLLKQMIEDYEVEDVVQLIASPTEEEKFALFRACDSALYTPPDEHFGIVPIEALDQRRPVIVCDSGGPAETVIEDVTGTRIESPTGEHLAAAMIHHINKKDWPELDYDVAFQKQRIRFERLFSQKGFCDNIDKAIATMLPEKHQSHFSRGHA